MAEHDTPRDGDAERMLLPLDKDPESWARVSAQSVMDGSYSQTRNVIRMALHDIAALAQMLAARNAALCEARTEIERLKLELTVPTKQHAVTRCVLEINTDDLIFRLRNHVRSRGTPDLPNGAWALMLVAADRLEELRAARREADARGYRRGIEDAARVIDGFRGVAESDFIYWNGPPNCWDKARLDLSKDAAKEIRALADQPQPEQEMMPHSVPGLNPEDNAQTPLGGGDAAAG